MNKHYYMFMYQIKINNGHADCDIRMGFDETLKPSSFGDIRKHLMELNRELNPISLVFTGVFYIGKFKSDEVN